MLLQPNETGDYVNITDWTAQPVDDLLGQIEWHADVLRGATLYDLDNIMAPAWELARRVEAAEAKLAESATRVAELKAQLTVARDTSESVFRWAKALSDGMSRGRARVAELEAQLAAQQWRPGNVEPPAHDWYWVYDFADDDVPTRRFYGPQGWGMLGDEDAPDWYMPIPPLPAETTL